MRVEVRANDERIVSMTLEEGVTLEPGLDDAHARFQQVLDVHGEVIAVFRADRLVSASVAHGHAHAQMHAHAA